MEASTTIVNVNPEQLDKLVEYMSGIVGAKLSKPKNVTEFAATMVQHADALIAGADDSDAEGCFQVLFKDIQLEADAAAAGAAAQAVAAKLSANTGAKPLLRLKVLANLFNVLSVGAGLVGSSRAVFLSVFLSVVKYASAVGQVAMLQGYFDLLDALVVKWRLAPPEARSLFLEVAAALDASGHAEKSQLFLVKYLATFPAGAAVPPEAKAVAVKGAVGAVKSPIVAFVERHNVAGLAPVAALQGDPEHGALFGLLDVFASGNLSAYRAFVKANPKVLAKYTLDGDACVKHMRVLSLCSLATQHSELPYALVARDLDVDETEVEAWVVAAISSQLLEAKMDQSAAVVMVSRANHRAFGPAEWQALQAKLHAWQANLQGILATLNKATPSA